MTSNGDERSVGDDEFKCLTRDDAKARMLRKVMQNLAQGDKGDALAEMAREVVSGRSGIRDAIANLPHQEDLEAKWTSFQQRWDSMSESDKFAAERESRQFLQEQQSEIDAERAEAARAQARQGRHSGRGWSLY